MKGPATTSVDQPPLMSPIVRVPPYYPAAAVRKRLEGRVLMEANVDRNGRVSDVSVVASEPEGLFDDAAVRSFSLWKYCPLLDGHPDYPNPIRIAIPFRIR